MVLDMLRNLFLPKKFDFYGMFQEQSAKSIEAQAALKEYILDPSDELEQKIHRIEESADEIRKNIIVCLHETFITPIDREDIFSLSRALDDTIDYARTTVEEFRLFEIKNPDAFIKKIVEALYNASVEIHSALEKLEKQPKEAIEHLIRAKKTENFIEHRYREGLADLFKHTDVAYMLKTREIYRHLSNAADRFDDSADIINDIITKMI